MFCQFYVGLSREHGIQYNEDTRDNILRDIKPGDVVQLRHKMSMYPWCFPPTLKRKPTPNVDTLKYDLDPNAMEVQFESLCLVIQEHCSWYCVLCSGIVGWINRMDIIGGP